MKLAGKRVVIVGGSSGIGLAVAGAAREEGASVFIGSSRAENIEAAKEKLGGDVAGAAIDATSENSIAAFFKEAGAFDHLVFTAGDWGSRAPKPISEVEVDDFQQLLLVRFFGALLAIKHGIGNIREGGSITLTDGITAHRPRKGAPLATAMAGAVEHLVRGLAVDVAPVRVNGVCPGVIGTAVWGEDAAEQFKAITDPLPLPRMGKPEEVAEAYLYLMKGGYTTGQVLLVDGGRAVV